MCTKYRLKNDPTTKINYISFILNRLSVQNTRISSQVRTESKQFRIFVRAKMPPHEIEF